MLPIIAELHFDGVRVISVADGLESDDEDSTLAIQVRGIVNGLRLRHLKTDGMGAIPLGWEIGIDPDLRPLAPRRGCALLELVRASARPLCQPGAGLVA